MSYLSVEMKKRLNETDALIHPEISDFVEI